MSTREEIKYVALENGWQQDLTFPERNQYLEVFKQDPSDRRVRLRVEFSETGRIEFAAAMVRGKGEQRITGGRQAVLRYIRTALT